jgi:hypothetical protein
LIIDQNRTWGQQNGRPRIIADVELVDIFGIRTLMNLLTQGEQQHITPYLRMMLATRLLTRSEYAQMRRQISNLRDFSNRFISIGQMLLLRTERIVQNPHQFPQLLTTLEIGRFMGIASRFERYASNMDILLGGASAAGAGAQSGRSYSTVARVSHAGAVVGYVALLSNVTANHYGSYERAYALELSRRGVYVR